MASKEGIEDVADDSFGKKTRVMRLRTLVLVCLLLSLVGFTWRSWLDATTRQFERTFVASDGSGETIDYLLNLPGEYRADDRRWPLILFLHGSGECGEDLDKVKRHGPLVYADAHDDFPFLVVSPQARERGWEPTLLAKLLDEVTSQYRVDEDRIYVTGYSMGGGGTWSVAIAHPNRFAAIAPVCGYGDPAEAPKLKNTPVWAFHGAQDKTINVSQSENMVNALRSVHGDAKLTIFPDGGHNIRAQVYENPDLYAWLLSHSRRVGP